MVELVEFMVSIQVFFVVLGILYCFLPFAVFGTKDKLNRMIVLNEALLNELQTIGQAVEQATVEKAPVLTKDVS